MKMRKVPAAAIGLALPLVVVAVVQLTVVLLRAQQAAPAPAVKPPAPPAKSALAPGPRPPSPAAPAAINFQREIRPILSDSCFQCHGPDASTRMAGLRLDLKDT